MKSVESLKEAQQDIYKLEIFIERIEYNYGIFLIFGENDEKRVASKVSSLKINSEKVFVFWHKESNKHPVKYDPTLKKFVGVCPIEHMRNIHDRVIVADRFRCFSFNPPI